MDLYFNPLGYHDVDYKGYQNYDYKITAKQVLFQVAGYIPVIGIITGIAKCVIGSIGLVFAIPIKLFGSKSEGDEALRYSIILITRGTFEIIGLGILFLPLDITFTAIEHSRKNRNHYRDCHWSS